MLDTQETIKEIDKENMFEALSKFPEQIKESQKIVDESDLTSIYKIDNIIISGMGASAISGDIVQALYREKLDIPIFVNRDYTLPKWANKNTLLISQSYSGNTEETLHTFKHGYQKRCHIISITSGGKLEEYSTKREIPVIKIPSGNQPRASTGYILFSSLYAMKKIGLIQNEIQPEIDETIKTVSELKEQIKKETPENQNIAKQHAKKIQKTFPQVYGWGIYTPIAKRWCTQLNENSKLICRYDEVSECNHNDIVGWSMNPDISKKATCILMRDEELESIYMTKRLNFMKKLYNDVASQVIEIKPNGKKNLTKMMTMMYLGDYISCYLAILRKIDPSPVDAISELKKVLSRI